MIEARRRHVAGLLLRPAQAVASAALIAFVAAVAAGAAGASGTKVTAAAEQLGAVSAIPGTTGAWAVGETCQPAASACAGVGRTLVLRWSGKAWSKVSSPAPQDDDSLVGVSASSSRNAWAVGSYAGSDNENLLLHWNGSSWSQVKAPNLNENSLNAVTTTSSNNAWAVGTYQPDGTSSNHTLIEHWNGKAWSTQSSPDPAGNDWLEGVSALSPTDAWAVGYQLSTTTSKDSTLVLHWDGKKWSSSAAPAVASFGTELSSVTATSATDAWAVGWATNSNDFETPLVLHWNGSVWSQQSTPTDASNTELLFGVAAVSSVDAWAVGLGPCVGGSIGCPSHTLTLHWNGKAWAHVPSPGYSDKKDQNVLTGVAMTGKSVVVCGYYTPANAPGTTRAILLLRTRNGWAAQ